MLSIVGYTLIVRRGARAGLTKEYKAGQGAIARRFADKLDREYGAMCASVHPVFEGSAVAAKMGFTCTPASIEAEHRAELSHLDAQGFALASRQVAQ